MELRQAVPEDAKTAAQLIASTMGDYEIAVFGLGDRQRMVAALAGFFKLEDNRFSYKCTSLIEVDDDIAGLLLSFPSKDTARLSLSLVRCLVPVYGLGGAARFIARAIPSAGYRETERGEYYIANLATSPDFRRRGVGRFMLEAAETRARQQGLSRLSLLVEPENQAAIRLYEFYGFNTVRTNSVRYFNQGLHSCGLHRMVKYLDT